MQLQQLFANVPVLSSNLDPKLEIAGVQYDSRKVRPGDLFVAISGYASDGHQYIPAALAQGAVAVVGEQAGVEGPYIRVSSSRQVLAQMACNWFGHPAEELTLIGVTGTNGKTTTTFLLKSLLEQVLGARVGLIGTIQNMVGETVIPTERTTPESWEVQSLFRQMVDRGCQYAIMEVSSHALALNRVDGFRFHTGVFTNLTQDHLDFHKTMDAYLEAKAKLFTRCEVGVTNLDDPASQTLLGLAQCPMLTYGEQPGADLSARDIVLGQDHVSMTLSWQGKTYPARLNIPGDFSVHNGLAVLGAALSLELDPGACVTALGRAQGVKGRVEVVPTPGKDYTILIDYAHTPDGLQNVLETVRGFAQGRTVAVFGCGGDRDRTKRPIMGKIAAELADFVVVTSDNPRTEEPLAIIEEILPGVREGKAPYTVIADRREAIAWAMDHAQTGDVIVLAGKGHEDYQIIGTTKIHLDEREVIADHLLHTDKPEGSLNG